MPDICSIWSKLIAAQSTWIILNNVFTAFSLCKRSLNTWARESISGRLYMERKFGWSMCGEFLSRQPIPKPLEVDFRPFLGRLCGLLIGHKDQFLTTPWRLSMLEFGPWFKSVDVYFTHCRFRILNSLRTLNNFEVAKRKSFYQWVDPAPDIEIDIFLMFLDDFYTCSVNAQRLKLEFEKWRSKVSIQVFKRLLKHDMKRIQIKKCSKFKDGLPICTPRNFVSRNWERERARSTSLVITLETLFRTRPLSQLPLITKKWGDRGTPMLNLLHGITPKQGTAERGGTITQMRRGRKWNQLTWDQLFLT